MLDDLGGVALFNFRGSRLEFQSGLELMASLHMTEKPVLRWYSSCCRTPMFNSYANSRIPFLDIWMAVVEETGELRELLARMRHLFTESATGDASHLPKTSPAGVVVRTTPRLIREYLSGARKRNPLFDPATSQPIAAPRLVSAAERRALA